MQAKYIVALNNIYIADTFNHRVQVFNENGIYYTTIGGAWGSQGNIYVADLLNHRVEQYAPGKQFFLPLAVKTD